MDSTHSIYFQLIVKVNHKPRDKQKWFLNIPFVSCQLLSYNKIYKINVGFSEIWIPSDNQGFIRAINSKSYHMDFFFEVFYRYLVSFLFPFIYFMHVCREHNYVIMPRVFYIMLLLCNLEVLIPRILLKKTIEK